MREIICTICPLGCHVALDIDDEGKVKGMTGNQCNKGKKYVMAEFKAPVRILTATVLCERESSVLPVRTDKPVPKDKLKEIMQIIAKVRVRAPIRQGQEIIHDILGTGSNLISTGTFYIVK